MDIWSAFNNDANDEDLSEEAQARIRRINEQVAQAQERAESAQKLAAKVETLRQEVTSEDGEVTVEVDSVGRLIRIDFTDTALRLTAKALSQVTLETVNAARSKAGRQVMEMAAETFGRDSATVNQLSQAFGPVTDDDQPSGGDSFFVTR